MSPRPRIVDGIELRWETLVPGRPPQGLGLFVPARPNSILEAFTDEDAARTDDRLPYFATLWPAAVLLAKAVCRAGPLEGLRALDLGCGLGAVGLAASARGARTVFLDWEPRALPLVEESARALGLSIEATFAADWRDPPPLGTFDRIYAADVLYEDRNVAAVVRFLAEHLAEDGEAWVADPGRRAAQLFPAHLPGAGLTVTRRVHLGRLEDSTIEARVVVRERPAPAPGATPRSS